MTLGDGHGDGTPGARIPVAIPSEKPGDRAAPFSVLFFLLEGYSMMALSAAVEPLRSANRVLGRTSFAWSVAAERAGPVAASNGFEIQAHRGVADAPRASLTVVVASLGVEQYANRQVLAWLRRLKAEGRLIGAVSNGAMILARAGVVGGHRVTLHWEQADALAEAHPDVRVTRDLYCWDRGVVTAAGGTAALDMMLAIIAEREGFAPAAAVAEQFLHGRIRAASEAQRENVGWRFGVTDERVTAAIRLMEGACADPLRIARIAELSGISERQLERLFTAEFGRLPSEFYMEMRLKIARGWLLNTGDSLNDIAHRAGFSSLGHFSRSYKAHFGESPSVARRRRTPADGGFLQEYGDPR